MDIKTGIFNCQVGNTDKCGRTHFERNTYWTAYVLWELVSSIYIDTSDKSSGKRVKHIHIKYNGLGIIPLNELMKEKTA